MTWTKLFIGVLNHLPFDLIEYEIIPGDVSEIVDFRDII
jgi:hypothetical protein